MSDSATDENNESVTSHRHHHSLVDRTIVAVMCVNENGNETPSQLPPSTERLHRLHGTSLILSATTLLKLGASTYATACTIFHRFYHQASLQKYNVWSTAMASTLLATKVEEEPRPIRQIILIYSHLYRRRRLACHKDASDILVLHNDSVQASPLASSLPLEQKETLLRHVKPLSPLGPIYQEWSKALTDMEQILLRQLGFTIYWIPDSHPHRYILYFVRVLEIDRPGFAQNAWKYCNDSCRIDLCVRFQPELIACAAIHMAACDADTVLPPSWWDVFVGSKQSDRLSCLCNALAGLREHESVTAASVGFVTSLTGDSFNDPESYLWSAAD